MSNLLELLHQVGNVSQYTKIELPLVGKATIYGFVVYNDNTFPELANQTITQVSSPPLGKANVVGNRIIFAMDNKIYRFPIFSSVEKSTKECYPVYLLYVPRLMDLKASSHVAAYKDYMKNEKPQQIHKGNIWKVDGIKVIDNKALYFPKDDEYVFESSSPFTGIGNAFMVITRRVSSNDGSLIYEVFDPNEVKVVE